MQLNHTDQELDQVFSMQVCRSFIENFVPYVEYRSSFSNVMYS